MSMIAMLYDPIELMELRIDQQESLIDENFTYPCCECGKRYPLDDYSWTCMSPAGDGPLTCMDCMEIYLKIRTEEANV
jgi:hypothetical protein